MVIVQLNVFNDGRFAWQGFNVYFILRYQRVNMSDGGLVCVFSLILNILRVFDIRVGQIFYFKQYFFYKRDICSFEGRKDFRGVLEFFGIVFVYFFEEFFFILYILCVKVEFSFVRVVKFFYFFVYSVFVIFRYLLRCLEYGSRLVNCGWI